MEHKHQPDGKDAGAHPNDPYFCDCGKEIQKTSMGDWIEVYKPMELGKAIKILDGHLGMSKTEIWLAWCSVRQRAIYGGLNGS